MFAYSEMCKFKHVLFWNITYRWGYTDCDYVQQRDWFLNILCPNDIYSKRIHDVWFYLHVFKTRQN